MPDPTPEMLDKYINMFGSSPEGLITPINPMSDAERIQAAQVPARHSEADPTALIERKLRERFGEQQPVRAVQSRELINLTTGSVEIDGTQFTLSPSEFKQVGVLVLRALERHNHERSKQLRQSFLQQVQPVRRRRNADVQRVQTEGSGDEGSLADLAASESLQTMRGEGADEGHTDVRTVPGVSERIQKPGPRGRKRASKNASSGPSSP